MGGELSPALHCSLLYCDCEYAGVLTAECNQCMATSKRMAASRDGENVNEDGNAAYFKLCILVYSKMKSRGQEVAFNVGKTRTYAGRVTDLEKRARARGKSECCSLDMIFLGGRVLLFLVFLSRSCGHGVRITFDQVLDLTSNTPSSGPSPKRQEDKIKELEKRGR